MRLGGLVGLVPLLGFLLLWQIAVAVHLYPPVLLPPPAKVAAAFALYGPSIAANTLASVTRVLIGIGLAFCVAVPSGLLIGRYPALDRLCDWSIQTFRSVPPISLIPMAMLFFGIGDTPAIVLIFLSGLWPLLLNTIFGVRGIERTMLKVATAAGASEALILRDIIWPAALPNIFHRSAAGCRRRLAHGGDCRNDRGEVRSWLHDPECPDDVSSRAGICRDYRHWCNRTDGRFRGAQAASA